MTTRRRFTADFKARVALDALRGDKTVQEIAARYKVHPNPVSTWKRQAIDGLGAIFSNGVDKVRVRYRVYLLDRRHRLHRGGPGLRQPAQPSAGFPSNASISQVSIPLRRPAWPANVAAGTTSAVRSEPFREAPDRSGSPVRFLPRTIHRSAPDRAQGL